jgi:hypothetical protein
MSTTRKEKVLVRKQSATSVLPIMVDCVVRLAIIRWPQTGFQALCRESMKMQVSEV